MDFDMGHTPRVPRPIEPGPDLPGFMYRAYYSTWVRERGYRYEVEVAIEFDVFSIVKETPCGVWISHPDDMDNKPWKWIHRHWIKAYAYPTKKLAMNSLLIRKRRHKACLESRIEDMACAIRMLEEYLDEK